MSQSNELIFIVVVVVDSNVHHNDIVETTNVPENASVKVRVELKLHVNEYLRKKNINIPI